MHSVLSKTKYQHLSGTRCAMDVVEIPSHVFEYFAWDADALKLISEHRSTGEALPVRAGRAVALERHGVQRRHSPPRDGAAAAP